MTAWWTCCVDGAPIDGDPHEHPDPPEGTDGDVCAEHCPVCNDPAWPIAVQPIAPPFLGIAGHPGPTQDQAARGGRLDRTAAALGAVGE